MEKFVVSARKYRPSTFDSVVGQRSITDTLKNAIRTNHLAQAFLFCGSRGVGKTTCARILAKTINCSNRTDNIEACNECDSCKAFNEGTSLNILEMDAASNNSVDNIRELTDQVRFAPQIGDYKVYIIDEVHMLSQAAFNAFLKTLEEPPAHAIFILATTEKHKIIPTILSRCQIFDFNRIRVEDISAHLAFIAQKEGIAAEEEALHIVAQKADGALRDALSIFDQLVSFSGQKLSYQDVITNLNILDYDYYFKCTDILNQSQIPQALLLFDEIRKRGFDGHLFINGLASHLRNLLVCQDELTLELLEAAPSVKERYRQQAGSVSSDFIMKALDICAQCDAQYKGSKNQRLLVELSLMQMASINSDSATAVEKKKHHIKSEIGNLKSEIESLDLEHDEQVNPENENRTRTSNSDSSIEKPEESVQSVDVQSTDSKRVNLQRSEVKNIENGTSEDESRPRSSASALSEESTQPQPEKAELANSEKTDSKPKKPIVSEIKPDRTRSLSIHALTNEHAKVEEAKTAEAYTSDDRNDFDQEKLMEVWNKLIKKIETEAWEGGSLIVSAMNSRKPNLLDDYKIEVLVDNKSQAEELMLRRTDLHDYLRKNLANGAIEVIVKVNKNQELKKAYTDEEKFREMAEENPNILKLRQQFDLDFL
jgi:DNA polymerase-3 subunit gamma/tau